MDREAELRLVEGLRRGEASAFDAVYEEYRPGLFSFVLRMVGRRETAEELAQEAWMRLVAKAGSLRADTRLAPWLFTVARNLCLSYWRTRGIEGSADTDSRSLERLTGGAPSPQRGAESSEGLARLEAAIAGLPPRYREALLLVGIEGMAPGEAAGVCGLTPEAMRKRLERARDLLAARLDPSRSRDVLR
jgi:RNA polymerase sigma-70 factor (ECF subfamily)